MLNQIEKPVLFETIPAQNGSIGKIILNRPKALNAINDEMFVLLTEKLAQWQQDDSITAVIITSNSEKAFCAGGDVRHIYDIGKTDYDTACEFFHREYELNKTIYHFRKPYISLIHGITMGGGAGVSIHGQYKIACEDLRFAMPETTIGFFPDVGGSYFLSRLPNHMGLYLGLTGNSITASECLELKLINNIINKNNITNLINNLTQMDFTINNWQDNLDKNLFIKNNTKINNLDLIKNCFDAESIEAIFESLKQNNSNWSNSTLEILKQKSPTSLKVVFEQIKLGKTKNLDQCLEMEFRLVKQFLKKPDFYEGIRAAIIDKDRNPQWQPNHLEEITDNMVKNYFD